MSILVLGTAALDSVKTPHGYRRDMLGGSAVHFAMGSRLFAGVSLAAVVGEDFPDKHLRFLKASGVDLASVVVQEGKTFRWSGDYRADMNVALTLKTELGVLSAFRPRLHSSHKAKKYVFLANVDPDIQHELLTHMRAPRLIGLDSMNFWIQHKKKSLLKLFKKVHVFVANDAEARSLTGEVNLLKAARALRKLGVAVVVIKKGEHGVFLLAQDFVIALPAYPSECVVDPTGAGDTFAGGFMGYLAREGKINRYTLRQALLHGTIMASFNVEGFGLERSSKVAFKDIQKRLHHFRAIAGF